MSSITWSPSGGSEVSVKRSVNWARYARIGLVTTLAAALANVVLYYLGGAFARYDSEFVVLSSAFGIAIMTVIPAVIAVLLYGALLRNSENPVRHFTVISAVTLVLSLIPNVTIIPSEPGVTVAQGVILALMHVVAAAVIVRTLTAYARPEA